MKKNNNLFFVISRRIAAVILFFLGYTFVQAQVKIGDNANNIDPASILELESTSRALVLTRVTDAQMQLINPLQGAVVFNTDQQCIFYFDVVGWNNLCAEGGSSGGDGAILVDNEDDTYTFTDGNGNETIIAFDATGATILDNGDDTYTFTDGTGAETIISFDASGGEAVTGEPGSVFFAGTDGNATENNAELFWDNTNSSLGIGTNTGMNDKLTINGTLGVSNGSVTEPSYRFSNDADSGMYRIGENEIGFVTAGSEIMRIDENSLILNDALTPVNNNIPLIIKGNGTNREFIGFQVDANPDPLYRINIRGAGLNFDNINKPNQLFLSIFPEGNVGIGTDAPSETLDVVGTLRVRNLAAAETTDNFVTVDADGVFHRSSTNSVSGKSTLSVSDKFSGRWTNGNLATSLKFGITIAPVFITENFNDGGDSIYEVNGNSLVVKTSGVYDLRANISLVGSNISTLGNIATTSARIHVNGLSVGAIFVASNNGSKNKKVISSIHMNEFLKLKTGDVITIVVATDALSNTIFFNSEGTSNFSITNVN